MRTSRWKRATIVVLSGGVLLQAPGCTAALAPILLSLGESTFLAYLFGGILPF
jgi:hypothetical protein